MRIRRNDVIEVCDFCQRFGYLRRCIICKRQFCLICNGVGGNVYNQNICKECIKQEDVEEILNKGLKTWRMVQTKQKNLLKQCKVISKKRR